MCWNNIFTKFIENPWLGTRSFPGVWVLPSKCTIECKCKGKPVVHVSVFASLPCLISRQQFLRRLDSLKYTKFIGLVPEVALRFACYQVSAQVGASVRGKPVVHMNVVARLPCRIFKMRCPWRFDSLNSNKFLGVLQGAVRGQNGTK